MGALVIAYVQTYIHAASCYAVCRLRQRLSRHSGGCPRIYIVAGQLRVVKQMTTTFVSVFSALHEPTFLCLRAKRTFNTISDLKVTDQSPLSGLLG